MEPVLQMDMLKLKQGKFTKTESSVYCKLYPGTAGEPPQIHCFEKHKSTEPESVLKVKSLSCVEKHNQVPRVVKARYENYLLVRSVGGQETYLRTETRQQRDEWFDQLQRLLDHSQAGRYVEVRTRRHTENAQSRPPPRTDPRGKRSMKSSPASAQGIFKEELEQKVQSIRNSKPPEQIANSENKCCPCHHEEIGHDGQEPVYQNIHWVKDLQQFQRDSDTSREALKESAALYNDFHRIASLQSQAPEEDEYEPVYYRNPTGAEQSLEQRFSGVSVNSEEDSQEGPLPLRSFEPRKVPVEQSWPPSVPGSPSEEQEPSGACSDAFRLELEGKLNRRLSTGLPQCTVPEPEASLCLPSPEEGRVDESYRDRTTTEAVYQNVPSTSRLRRADALPSKRQPPPPLPRRRQTSEKARKLLREKMQSSVEMGIPKAAMIEHGLGLTAVNDSILVTTVPPPLKADLFVGDQLVMVNDQLLDSVDFAVKCINMSQARNANVKLTVKRIPFGTVCEFDWKTKNRIDVGLNLKGPEITVMSPRFIEASRGLQSSETAGLTTAGIRCNFAITEINFDPVDARSSTEEVWLKLDRAKPHIALVLHPVDFLEYLHEDTYESVN